jgi:arsenite methyltransferase
MKDSEQLKIAVKEKYTKISEQSGSGKTVFCCGSDTVDYSVFSEDYSKLEGYNPEADLGLGCGLPTEYAGLKQGDTVVDLGSGAGNDCFIARREVGETGRVIGIDFAEAMVQKARENASKLNYTNVEFHTGDIEQIPLPDETADVVVSNCVLNLVPDKRKAFSETYRIQKKGGHFSISDVITIGNLPAEIRKDLELYAGCVAGAMEKEEYLSVVKKAGFTNLTVQKLRKIEVPDEVLTAYLSAEELNSFHNSNQGVYSITLYAEKE